MEGKIAVVTGGAEGIGRGIAECLAKAGALVVIADLNVPAAEATAADINAAGGSAQAIGANVASADDVGRLFREVSHQFGRLDILVNNAGIIVWAPSQELALEQWRKVIDVNLTGVFLCSQAAMPLMKSNGGGSIVNIASLGAYASSPGFASYSASKSAVLGLSRSLAVEWGPHNIRVNSVCPGNVDTPLSRRERALNPESFARRDRRIPLRKPGAVEHVAKAVLFLAGSDSEYVSGWDIAVDGGMLAQHPGYVA